MNIFPKSPLSYAQFSNTFDPLHAISPRKTRKRDSSIPPPPPSSEEEDNSLTPSRSNQTTQELFAEVSEYKSSELQSSLGLEPENALKDKLSSRIEQEIEKLQGILTTLKETNSLSLKIQAERSGSLRKIISLQTLPRLSDPLSFLIPEKRRNSVSMLTPTPSNSTSISRQTSLALQSSGNFPEKQVQTCKDPAMAKEILKNNPLLLRTFDDTIQQNEEVILSTFGKLSGYTLVSMMDSVRDPSIRKKLTALPQYIDGLKRLYQSAVLEQETVGSPIASLAPVYRTSLEGQDPEVWRQDYLSAQAKRQHLMFAANIAISKNPTSFKDLPDELKDHKNLAATAVFANTKNMNYVSGALKFDQSFAKTILSKHPELLPCFGDSIHKDLDFLKPIFIDRMTHEEFRQLVQEVKDKDTRTTLNQLEKKFRPRLNATILAAMQRRFSTSDLPQQKTIRGRSRVRENEQPLYAPFEETTNNNTSTGSTPSHFVSPRSPSLPPPPNRGSSLARSMSPTLVLRDLIRPKSPGQENRTTSPYEIRTTSVEQRRKSSIERRSLRTLSQNRKAEQLAKEILAAENRPNAPQKGRIPLSVLTSSSLNQDLDDDMPPPPPPKTKSSAATRAISPNVLKTPLPTPPTQLSKLFSKKGPPLLQIQENTDSSN